MVDHSKVTPGYWYVKDNSDIRTLSYSIVRVDEKMRVWMDACEYESMLREFEFIAPVPAPHSTMYAVRYVSATGTDCLRIGFPNHETAVAWKEKRDPDGRFKAYVLVPDMTNFAGLIILHKED